MAKLRRIWYDRGMYAVAAIQTQIWLGISVESWLTITAIVAGPILALFAQRVLDDLRETHERQVRLFRELMITRSTRLSPRHVEALNAVPLEFRSGKSNARVLNAWKTYLEHLGSDSTNDADGWNRRSTELLVELLYEISERVDLPIEKLSIENEVYLPRLFNIVETEQTALRRNLLEVLNGTGGRKIPVAVFAQRFPDLVDGPSNGSQEGADEKPIATPADQLSS
jgi:Family of unknown function (DUF6680)